MASFISSLLVGKQRPYDFHNDQSLHDATTADPKAWYSNLSGDAWAIIKNLSVYVEQGKEQGAKYTAGSLDLDDPLSKAISKKLVSMLWGSLLHPPPNYRGLEYRYRTADGSNNSVLFPHLGKAGLPYAKTVPSQRPMHGARPDPGDLFDLLMARDDTGVESKSGISMMLLYHATVIIHDIFRTDDNDSNSSATSSYLDLAPLYGSDVETQESVRQMRDGLLKPDTFAEKRLLRQPPGVCIYIIMYNRFHNYVAKQLKTINEHGRFSLPPGCDGSPEARADPQWAKAFKLQDEHLFQTARLITCGMYINVAIHDYLKCLMGVHEIDTPWTLDPRKALPETDNKKGLDRGEGNMVSVEFNMLYRFHSPISKRDAEWSEALFVGALRQYIITEEKAKTPEGKAAIESGEKFTEKQIKNGEFPVAKFKEFLDAQKKQSPASKDADKKAKYFPQGLDMVGATGPTDMYRFKRNDEGLFDDAQLAAEMCRAMEDPICQFGAQNIPKVFKSIEIMGILQARKWEVATLNEFREFFGMSRFKSFEEINSNPDIQNKLRYLYEDPDLVELYPGLFCEGQGRNLDPGTKMPENAASSLWRGVFSDAVTLVRSDRFYTLDWNVGSLTAWGMKEVTSDPKVNKGSVMGRLFERAFPGCFKYNSVHMWQPFYTPTKNIQLAHDQGYLSSLNTSGLVDRDGKELVFTRSPNQIFLNDEPYTKWKQSLPQRLARRKLKIVNQQLGLKWRGNEIVERKSEPVEVTSYRTIREQILGGPNSGDFINPVILEPTDIPDGPLQEVMTKRLTGLKHAIDVANKSLPADWEQVFMDYFVGLAQDIRLREQRPLQTREVVEESGIKHDAQILQLDVIKDLAIPVITRFFADLAGFWDEVKTLEFVNRKYDENEIYRHIENCQNFEACDSDPTKAWKRRMEFRESIKVLKQLTENGVRKSQAGVFENVLYRRNFGTDADGQHVKDLRKIGVGMVQALSKGPYSTECVAAIMLHTALDAAQRFVLTFSESLAYFIDPAKHKHWHIAIASDDAQTELWEYIKKLSWQDTVISNRQADLIAKLVNGKNDEKTTAELEQYVLEAARLSNSVDVTRVYSPANEDVNETEIVIDGKEKRKIRRGDTILLNLRKAYSDPDSGLEDPECFRRRHINDYIGFGPTVSPKNHRQTIPPVFSKRAAIIGITGLIKHCAHLQELRVAHDKAGRIQRVKTPDGTTRYASPQLDLLLPFPTTWNVRYDGVGKRVFCKGDNADQGHGQNMIWHYESLNTQTDGRAEAEEKRKAEDQKELDRKIKEAVDKAVEEALKQVKTQPTAPGLIKQRPHVHSVEVAADCD